MTKLPFTSLQERASELLALVHIDVFGLKSSIAKSGIRHKSESFEKFNEFQNETQNHMGKIITFQ